MNRTRRRLSAAALAVTLTPRITTADQATLAKGRELSKMFLDRQTDALWSRMTPTMQSVVKSAEGLAGFRRQVESQLGTEEQIISERTDSQPPLRTYSRIARWSKAPVPIEMQWAVDDADKIAGFSVRPAKPQTELPSSYLDYQTKAPLRLPFDGEWFVFWRGRTLQQNYHTVTRDQRFAYDFVKRRAAGGQPRDSESRPRRVRAARALVEQQRASENGRHGQSR